MRSTIKIISLLLALLLLFQVSLIPVENVLAQESPPVLAFYYAWFDQNTWSSGQSVDLPLEPYNSADRSTIERHVAQAQSAGIDAFVQSWYGPQENNNQTESNFRVLLDVAQATGFKAAVDVEVTSPFLSGAGSVTDALATLLATHAQHPAYLRYQGKPVIFFWRQQTFTVEEWAAIRNQVDPDYNSYWIAEGIDIAYQAVFDGHHLYSIAWAASPAEQLAKWGDQVRSYAGQNQTNRLWVATAMPGYDDTRLPREDAFAVPRRNGDYYRETWQGAVASQPDMIIINSFNEWLEGTHLEPGVTYGNLYLDITRELVTAMRGSPPAAPAPASLTQEIPPEEPEAQETVPAGPYIKTVDLTNVRRYPAITATRLGSLAAGATVSVTGRTAAGDWWQIDFPGDEGEDKGWVAAEVVEFVGDAAEPPVVEVPIENTPSPSAAESSEAVTVTPDPSDPPLVKVPAGKVKVRDGPSLEAELVGELEENTTAIVLAKNETGDWWQINYPPGENERAWVADAVVDFIGDKNSVPVAVDVNGTETPEPPQTATPIPTSTPTPTPVEPVIVGRVEAIDPVNVRDEPSLEGVLLGGLYPGEEADVLAISPDEEWWQIDFPGGPDDTGWVAAEFVRFRGEIETVPIFGLGTPTPTPGPTDTPTATPSPTPLQWPPTYAPTATSIYQATSAALLAERGTPEAGLSEPASNSSFSLQWGDIPWGILSAVVVIGIFWYQFGRRRRSR